MSSMEDVVTCVDETKFGLTIKGCGWTGKKYELIENYFNTFHPYHPLSGSEGYEYVCPKCGKVYKKLIMRQG